MTLATLYQPLSIYNALKEIKIKYDTNNIIPFLP